MKQQATKKPYLQSNYFESTTVRNVPLPEDNSKTRDWSVDIALLKQCVDVASVKALNGRITVPLEELLECNIYLWCNVRRNADHVLFIGDFSAEPSQELVDCGRKLLCARMQSILLAQFQMI